MSQNLKHLQLKISRIYFRASLVETHNLGKLCLWDGLFTLMAPITTDTNYEKSTIYGVITECLPHLDSRFVCRTG